MDREQYTKFHKKVKALGIAMLCVVGITLILVIVGVALYQSNSLLLIIGLPVCLSLDVTLVFLCYFFARKDRELRTELSVEIKTQGVSDLFAQIYRDFRTNHLESVWDSVTPNGWKFSDVYEAEGCVELVIDKRVAPSETPQTITVQFDKSQVTVFYDVGEEQQVVTRPLTNSEFADFASLVIWLGKVCQQFAQPESDK